MAGEFGGRADKLGNEFERVWVVSLALGILHGELRSLRWEPLAPEGHGIDVQVIRGDGSRAAHQCKWKNGTAGKWPLSRLRAEGVLTAIKEQIDQRAARAFVFVSRDPSPVLDELARRARGCNRDARAFCDALATNKDLPRSFDDLCRDWALDPGSVADIGVAIDVLSRLEFAAGYDGAQRRVVDLLAGRFVTGSGTSAVAVLGAFLSDRLGNDVYADELRAALRDAHLPPLDLEGDPTVASSIETLGRRFEAALEPYLIRSSLLPREEAARTLDLLRDAEGSRLIVLHGAAGGGKSGVLLEVLRRLIADGVPTLPIRLDAPAPRGAVSTFARDELGLPASPAYCLAALAGSRTSVLIVDQVDAVRWTASHSDEAWSICKEIVDAALTQPRVRVLLACRTFDLYDDRRLRRWRRGKESRSDVESLRTAEVEVGPLPAAAVRQLVGSLGVDWDSLPPRLQALLVNPFNLRLWCDLQSGRASIQVTTQAQLLRAFWDECRRRLRRERSVGSAEVNALLDTLADYLNRSGVLEAPLSLIAAHVEARDGLQSLNVLRVADGRIGFAHQSFLDFLVAQRVLKEAALSLRTPIEWLRTTDQSLFYRDQLCQLLGLLREEQPTSYVEALRALFAGNDIRFHLQHLALSFLAALPAPNEEEHELVRHLLDEPKWREHVLWVVVAVNVSYFERLSQGGTIAEWLRSPDPVLVNEAKRLCSSVVGRAPEAVERAVMTAFGATSGELAKVAPELLGRDPALDTEEMFQWRISAVESGAEPWALHSLEDLSKRNTGRAVLLLAACVRRAQIIVMPPSEGAGSAAERAEIRQRHFLAPARSQGLREACSREAVLAWQSLAPVLITGVEAAAQASQQLRAGYDTGVWKRRRDLSRLNRVTRCFLGGPATRLLGIQGQRFWRRLDRFGRRRSKSLDRLVASALLHADETWADTAIAWLLRAPKRRLALSSGRLSLPSSLAVRLIRRFADSCNPEVYAQLELEVLRFHPRSERKAIAGRLSSVRAGEPVEAKPNRYGWHQNALLTALPASRASETARRAARAWRSKFGPPVRPPALYRGGRVTAPVPEDRLSRLSDREWLRITQTDWSRREGRDRWRQRGGDLLEASHEQFSRALGRAAEADPGRFVRLALRMSQTVPPAYIRGLLDAASKTRAPAGAAGTEAWSAAPAADCELVIARFGHLADDDEVAKAICRLLQRRPEEPWSSSLLDRVAGYAQEHKDPAPDEFAVRSYPPGTTGGSTIPDVETSAINCVRGCASEALAAVLFERREMLPRLEPAVRAAVRDPHPAVRVAAQSLCAPIYNIDRGLAVELLLAACDHPDDSVLHSGHLQRLLPHLWHLGDPRLEPLLRRMAASEREQAAELGAYWITVGQLLRGLYADISYSEGKPANRRGRARALRDVAKQEVSCRSRCFAGLASLFDDPDESVRRNAGEVMVDDDVLKDGSTAALAVQFVRTRAFEDSGDRFLQALEELDAPLQSYAAAILAVAERFEGDLRDAVRSSGSGLFLSGDTLATLLLRLYQQINRDHSPDMYRRCLDAFDALLRANVGHSRGLLRQIDA